jgi:glucose-1-phosphate thymidylyltransferase
MLPVAESQTFDQRTWEAGNGDFAAARLDEVPAISCALPLIDYPHEIIRFHKQYLAENLTRRIDSGAYREVADGVFAADGATVEQQVVTDTTAGPIVLEEGASIGAQSYVQGPVHLGQDAKLLEFACVKNAVAVGQSAKIGGEVVASIIEPYSNKQHHGYLGNSYVGSWVNLGAGTSNSDLKNTYGEVRIEHDGEKINTGTQFMGCVIGDYVKSAVNTAIFTGKIVGVSSMLYGFITTNVPGFVNFARTLGYVMEIPLDVAITTQRRVFRRRGVSHQACDIELMRELFELTRVDREAAISAFACCTPVP